MKIFLFGYGKMGKEIERLALANGDSIIGKADSKSNPEHYVESLKKADVAIDFSTPETAYKNVRMAIESGVPVLSGTTGWNDKIVSVRSLTKASNGTFFYASNFSLGVNIFFHLNRKLAKLMNSFAQYDVKIAEWHHTQKKDAPSGTAITLATDILNEIQHKESWKSQEASAPQTHESGTLPILWTRESNIIGTHRVTYHSKYDSIEILHEAHDRESFAHGVLVAANWLRGRNGNFGMDDILEF